MGNRQIYDWAYLLERYFTNTISREELDQLLTMAKELQDDEEATASLKQYWQKAAAMKSTPETNLSAKFEALLDQERQSSLAVPLRHRFGIRTWDRMAAAVLLLFTLGAIAYYILNHRPRGPQLAGQEMHAKKDTTDLKPGTDGAILMLADGRQIDLDTARSNIVSLNGETAAINKDGKISYRNFKVAPGEALYNTVRTSKGKQYQIELSDGSKVWLNAASSIRFPSIFTGRERVVDITGEVYFEVAKTQAQIKEEVVHAVPFIVKFSTPQGNKAEVRVLGTHFNINAYDDEAGARTSLLEGSIQVSLQNGGETLLSPGQQALIGNSGKVNVSDNVDMEAVTAWKNGYFSFNKTDLASLMRQIGRWYNVDIEYAGAVPDRKFGGEISRNSNASQVLKILEESKVNFRIEGKKIIVLP